MKIIVYHSSYGCDTGCCGHVVENDTGDEYFQLTHPDGDDPLEFAKDLVAAVYGEEHVKDLDWENCMVSDE